MIVVQFIEVQFLAHSLQIRCIGLFGPLSFSFLGLEIKTCPYSKDVGVKMEDEELLKMFNPTLKMRENILFFLIVVINGLI